MSRYIKDPLNRDQLSFMATTACYTGYQFYTINDIVKCEMEVGVRDVDVYVAPTFINLENPTFWMNQGELSQESQNQDKMFDGGFKGKFSNVVNDGENLLRKIIFANNMSINLEFLNAELVDHLNPRLTMDVNIERLEGSMNGSEWWRFYHVIE